MKIEWRKTEFGEAEEVQHVHVQLCMTNNSKTKLFCCGICMYVPCVLGFICLQIIMAPYLPLPIKKVALYIAVLLVNHLQKQLHWDHGMGGDG